MASKRHRRARGDRGAAAVEFALVLPLLLIVVYGIIDFGRAYNAQETLTQAARVGARLAVVGQSNANVQAAVVKAAASTVSLQSSSVSITGSCAGGSTSVTVSATYSFSFLTPLPLPNPKLLGTATAPC